MEATYMLCGCQNVLSETIQDPYTSYCSENGHSELLLAYYKL